MHTHCPISSSSPGALRSSFSSDSLNIKPDSGARISVLPAAVVPYLRRLDVGDSKPGPSTGKPSLVTLTLSSPSFLDSKLTDESGHVLYRITTKGTGTTLSRADWHSSIRIGDLKWPLRIDTRADTVLVQVRGESYKLSTHILKPPKFQNSPRKFHVPGYTRALKWKQVASVYWCVSSSVKGPIATFEPASNGSLPSLKVFETFYDKYDPSPMSSHQGVSTLLLDYLVITALLLVTDVQDWMLVKKYEGEDGPLSPASSFELDSPAHSIPRTSATSLQLRKILYGEAIFPKQANPSAHQPSGSSSPPSPTRQQRPYLGRSASSSSLLAPTGFYDAEFQTDEEDDAYEFASPERDSDDDDEDDYFYHDRRRADEAAAAATVNAATRAADVASSSSVSVESVPPTQLHAPVTPLSPPSPSAESAYFVRRSSAGGAPAHTYLDPSFYAGEDDASAATTPMPPVPPIPPQFSSSVSSRSSVASGSSSGAGLPPSSPIAATPLASSTSMRSHGSRRTRELPRPPVNGRSPARSQSVPPQEHQRYQHQQKSPTILPSDDYPQEQPPPTPTTASMHHTRRHSLARGIGGSERRQLPIPPGAGNVAVVGASAAVHGPGLPQSTGPGSSQVRSTTLPPPSSTLGGSSISFASSSSSGSGSLYPSTSTSTNTVPPWLPPSSPLVKRGEGYATLAQGTIGRSLPPTPVVPKDPHHTRQSTAALFDFPPPAYSSIDFSEKPVSGSGIGHHTQETSSVTTPTVGSASSVTAAGTGSSTSDPGGGSGSST